MIAHRKSPLIPVIVFFGFVLANSLKTAVFDHLIVDEPASRVLAAGFFNKTAVVFLVCLLLTLPRRRILFALFYCLQLLYIYINLLYHFSFMGYLHISQYAGLFGEAFELARHSALPTDSRLLWVFLDLPLLIMVLWTYTGLSRISTNLRTRIAVYGIAVALLAFFLQWDVKRDTATSLMNNAYESDISVVQKYGLLTFNVVDMMNFQDGLQHIRGISYGPVISSAAADSADADEDAASRRFNIIMIQIESLDAYIIDRKYKNVSITPFFHALASSSVYYPYMLSYHEAGSTSDCEFSTINSIEPFDDYPSIKIRNYDYVNSMARQAAAAGYAVMAFHGNRGSYFNRTAAFKKMGFDKFFDMDSMGLHDVGWGAPDKSVFDFIAARLRLQKEPFFYYIITMSSHEPFTLTQPYYQNNYFSDVRNERTREYFNAISYVDREVGEFVRSIRSLKPNTYIFIMGDHTPVIAKDVYRRASFIDDGRQFEFVPFFIITPDSLAFRETRCAASFIDISPTVLAATRAPYSIRSSGANLLAHPIANTAIDYRGGTFLRADLYKRIKQGK